MEIPLCTIIEIRRYIYECVISGQYLYQEKEIDTYAKNNYGIIDIKSYPAPKGDGLYVATISARKGHNYVENIFCYEIKYSVIKQRIRDNKLNSIL